MNLVLAAAFMALGVVQRAAPSEGYLSQPESGPGPGVLVLHPWWGLNADVKQACDRLSEAGFTAYAPDLFDGKTANTPEEAEALVTAMRPKADAVRAKIMAAAVHLEGKTGQRKIGLIGYSYGAFYGLWFSNAAPDRVQAMVIYYGTGQEDFKSSRASYLGHFAENDDFEPKESVDVLRGFLADAKRPATFYTYRKTGHWFAEPGVKSAYSKVESDLAWMRTVRFLRETLGS